MLYPHIFQPGRIGKLTLKNRIKFASTTTGFCSEGGIVSPQEIAFLAERAQGGAALVTCGGAHVTPWGPSFPRFAGLWDDKHVPGFTKMVNAIHSGGAKACCQLIHCGRYAHAPGESTGPSAVQPRVRRYQMPRALSLGEIQDVVHAHGQAARRAKEAGFDVIEINSLAGYLVASFLAPWTNHRTDSYGGLLENRARLLMEVIAEIKKQIGADFPILVRMNSEEQMDGGNTPDDLKRIAQMAEAAGVNGLSISVGWHESSLPSITWEVPPGHWLSLAEGMKKAVKIPISMAYRLNSPDIAEKAIAEGKLDFWEMCRPLIADPELPNKLAQDKPDEVAPCTACEEGCFVRLWNNQSVRCLINPRAGYEADDNFKIKKAVVSKKILVVGGGPAGLEAARVAALRGHQVTLVEKKAQLGGQLALASRAPLRWELARISAYYAANLKKTGVNLELVSEVTPVFVQKLKPDVVVVATGAEPEIPSIPVAPGSQVVTAFQVLQGVVELGAKVVVWGGRQTGLHVAELLASQGKEVTVVEEDRRIGRDVPAFDVIGFRRRLPKEGIKVMASSTIKEIKRGEVLVNTEGQREKSISADSVVIAKGLSPNKQLWQALSGQAYELYIIGDALSPRKAINAIADGFRVGVKV